MRVNKNFVLRQIADVWVILPLGEESVRFNSMLKLNESSVLLWKALEQGANREDLANVLVKEYFVAKDQALADVDEYLDKLMKIGCLEKNEA